MRNTMRGPRSKGSRLAGCLGLLLTAVVAYPPVAGAAKGDADLMKELEGEAQKIGGTSAPAAPPEGKPAEKGGGKSSDGEEFPKGLSEEEFAKELKAAYSGTYTFYMKLAPNIRGEIYLDYKKGATIEQIRAKISERTMHR